MRVPLAVCVAVMGIGLEPVIAAETQVQLLAGLQRSDRQEFVGQPIISTGVAMTIKFKLVESYDATGVIPRRTESDRWMATCVGVAFSPDQVDTLSKLMYANRPASVRLQFVRHYLTTRRFWFVPGEREYTF